MRNALILTLAIVVWGSAAYAQGSKGYVQGTAGFSSLAGDTTGNATGEIGIRVLPKLAVFGNIGRMHDAGSSALQSSFNEALTALAATDLTATGTVHTPAWYSLGGARVNLPNWSAITPFVFGAVGFAYLAPSVRFVYDSGTTLTGGPATIGDDITSQVVANGFFATPATTSGLMLRTGGGVQTPLGKHLLGNVGYSVSRISADSPFHTQDLSFGLGVKF